VIVETSIRVWLIGAAKVAADMPSIALDRIIAPRTGARMAFRMRFATS
jgi:hypothetical protein